MTTSNTGERPTVLVLDDQFVWMRAVERILDAAGFGVTTTDSPQRALSLLRREPFKIVMVGADSNDPTNGGLQQILLRAKKLAPAIGVIVVGSDESPARIDNALELGADAYVAKRVRPEDLVFAIRQVLAPAIYQAWSSARSGQVRHVVAGSPRLTPRESEVLELLAQGRSNSEIATQLGISNQTVKGHLWRLFRKLGVPNRTAAARWAQRTTPGV